MYLSTGNKIDEIYLPYKYSEAGINIFQWMKRKAPQADEFLIYRYVRLPKCACKHSLSIP